MAFEKAKEMDLINDVWDGSLDEFRQDVLDYRTVHSAIQGHLSGWKSSSARFNLDLR